MPLTPEDQLRVEEAEREAQAGGSAKLLSKNTSESQKLGPFSVACTVWNRCIGSGIFVAPAIVLKATNSPGVSLLLWALGAFVGLCGLLVWLELGLSIPRFRVPRVGNDLNDNDDGIFTNVPRSGGEKNYLEHIYHSPQFRTTCIYGFIFVVFGNLCGNAIAWGIYVLQAAGMDDNAPLSRGLAVVALSVACALHAGWRQGGIVVNNVLAVIKVCILLAIIAIGFASAAGASFGNDSRERRYSVISAEETNFNVHKSFSNAQTDFASYVNALLFTVYSFGGFHQPFYVMSEVSQPKKKFAKSVSVAMICIVVLFLLVNVSYLCVVTNDGDLDAEVDMATVFFRKVFGNETAPRVMSGIIALSIFGNIVIMTFTASRVKQEIAKEGVLPFSRFFSMDVSTPVAWAWRKLRPSKASGKDAWLEQSPAPALFLHWLFTMLLIAATSSLAPAVAYQVLVSIYCYTLILLAGLFVAGGLLYLRWVKGKEWTENIGFRPWGGPIAAIIYSATCMFLLIATFVPPSAKSPFSEANRGYNWYVAPTVGISSAVTGYIYYLVFAKVIPRLRQQVLVVERDPLIVRQGGKPNGEWVQDLETIDFWWSARDPKSTV
ncbi:MAG: hypothetical protein Q9188_005086 [Gyalolechia gomerana]